MARETIEVSVVVHHQTPKALLVSDTGQKDDAIWLPKSQIETGDLEDIGEGENVTLEVTEWIATEKGLI